jgi:uncharacterized protein YjeT (DUF2065 family)
MLTLALMYSLAASPPQTLVTLSRRSGVAAPRALALARQVAEQLTGVPQTLPLGDSTPCKGKRLCLLTEARTLGATVLVTVEITRVLDDGSLRVEALSLDDDGRALGEVLVEGPFEGLLLKATPRLSKELAAAIRATLGVVEVPLVEAVPLPAPALAPIAVSAPVEPVTVVAAPSPSGLRGGQIVGLSMAAAGGAALLAAGALGVQALVLASNSRTLCPRDLGPCGDPLALKDYGNAVRAQNASVALSVAGGAAVAVGALVFFLDPGARESGTMAAVIPVQGGALGQVQFAW